MRSKDFEDFYFSCFDDSYGSHHNGVNIDALMALKGKELNKDKKDILAGISPEINDYRPIIAAGFLKLKRATPALEDILEKNISQKKAKLAWASWALYQINKSPEALDIILNLLENVDAGNDFYHYSTILEVIGNLKPTPEILEALFSRLLNHDKPVLISMRLESLFGRRNLSFIHRMIYPWVPREQVSSNLQALDVIPKQKRKRIQNGLLEKFKSTGNKHIAKVLGLLGIVETIPLLEHALKDTQGVDRLVFDVSLFRITPVASYKNLTLLFPYPGSKT